MRKELGFDPGQWGAIEGGRLVEYGADGGLKRSTSQTSAYPRITRPSCGNRLGAAGLGGGGESVFPTNSAGPAGPRTTI